MPTVGGPYLKLPSCLCLLSICSNSSEASTIPLSVWLSCWERTSQACGPHRGLACRATASQPGQVSKDLGLAVPMGAQLGELFLVHQKCREGHMSDMKGKSYGLSGEGRKGRSCVWPMTGVQRACTHSESPRQNWNLRAVPKGLQWVLET